MMSSHRSGRGRRRLALIGAVAGSAALLLTGCGSSGGSSPGAAHSSDASASNSSGPVDVGTGPNTPAPRPLAKRATVTVLYSAPAQSFMSLLMADYFKEFDKENLDVALKQVPTTDGAVLVARGTAQVQIAGFNASAFNLLAQPSSPIRYVASAAIGQPPTEGLWVNNDYVSNGKIDPVKIKGQQMALGIGGGGLGNPGAAAFYIQAKELGIPLGSVKPASLPAPVDIANALVNNRIAGGTIFGAAADVIGTQTNRFTMVQGNPPAGVFLASSSWLKDKPEVAAAFFRAIMRANRTYLQGDYLKDKIVLDAQAKILGSTDDQVIKAGLAQYSPDLDASKQETLLAVFQAMFRAGKVLSYDKDLTSEQVFDTSPVQAVLEGKY